MCTHPILVKNPYRRLGDKGINALHVTHTDYVMRPCGQCVQCLSMRQSWFNQRVQMESLRSELFMITLTYNRYVPTMDYCGYKLMWPDYRDIQNMCKRIRKKGYKFRSWFVSEYGHKNKRPHFHGLIAIDRSDYPDIHWSVLEQTFHKLFLESWAVNVGSKRCPKYKPLLDYIVRRNKRTFDFKHVEPILDHENDLSFYCSKYVFKYDNRTTKLLQKIKLDPSLDDLQTSLLTSLIKPRSCMSKDFGDAKDSRISSYINDCLSRSPDLPQFYDLYTGKACLLSPYYRHHLLGFDYEFSLFSRLSLLDDSLCIDDGLSLYEHSFDYSRSIRSEQKKARILRQCSAKY